MNILYTAFNGKNNSSKLLLDNINSVNKLYLKNSFVTSVEQLKKELDKNSYDLIIAFGQAPIDKDLIKIETIGKGNTSYHTKYDYKELKRMLDTNFKTVISSDAGNYFCNNIYYNGLKYIDDNSLKTDMIFIHIPYIDKISNINSLVSIFENVS